ncbi:Ser/Thr protein phosphatase [Tritrichomonas foetus]|uniref:protein-serine/threonine phosphatase n=1 Tax=Tritrichomonas foetus TaxID=1144522 RepID=A0A1J4KIP1_9EUKA|nr:Ser/Thr protein phosphatase [Tritrichomonas foetus]|eukprot:OHT10946.1 Ser/Thr protein phosphatase [Tritrichomonas foetus]
MMDEIDYPEIFRFIETQFTDNMEAFAKKQKRLKVPLIPPFVVNKLLTGVHGILEKEPSLLNLIGDYVIVGSLHGSFIDLLRILSKHGSPARQKYLFLGNLTGYGDFQVETVLVVYLMKILWPTNIAILRGYEEFTKACIVNGFREELDMMYQNCELFGPFMKTFSVLPIAGIINKEAFCVSGGIGKEIHNLKAIAQIKRPIDILNNQLLIELFNSEPTDVLPMYLPTKKGQGHLFGEKACSEFLSMLKLKLIFRSKNIVSKGYDERFNGKLVTLCSASGIERNNLCGIAIYGPTMNQRANFEFMPNLKRNDVIFITSISQYNWAVQKESNLKYISPVNSVIGHLDTKACSGLRLSTITTGRPNINTKLSYSLNVGRKDNVKSGNDVIVPTKRKSAPFNITKQILEL